MNTPSIETLREIFGDKANLAKVLLGSYVVAGDHLATIIRQYPMAVAAWRASFSKPDAEHIRMLALNELGEFHGAEACETINGEYAEYLNAGDTYVATLIYWRGHYRVQDLGTFIETQERRGIRFK